MTLVGADPSNKAFHPTNRFLQLAWDSVSLGAFKMCPRYYQYTIIDGYSARSMSVHLFFGIVYHAALERYEHARASGQDFDQGVYAAVRYAMEQTWDRASGKPMWFDHDIKDRFTLVRSVVWYLEQFKDDPLATVILATGKPAVELSFRMETTHQASDGSPFALCGHLDRLAGDEMGLWVVDKKTTTQTLGDYYFRGFSPDNQFTLYTLAAKVVYGTPVKGVVNDAVQIAKGFSRYERRAIPRTEAQLDEWYKDLGLWFKLAEWYAQNQYYPLNDKSCGQYGGCPFRSICSKPPSIRQKWLDAEFTKRVWDPLTTRGDV